MKWKEIEQAISQSIFRSTTTKIINGFLPKKNLISSLGPKIKTFKKLKKQKINSPGKSTVVISGNQDHAISDEKETKTYFKIIVKVQSPDERPLRNVNDATSC